MCTRACFFALLWYVLRSANGKRVGGYFVRNGCSPRDRGNGIVFSLPFCVLLLSHKDPVAGAFTVAIFMITAEVVFLIYFDGWVSSVAPRSLLEHVPFFC